MYKDILTNFRTQFSTVDDVIEYYARNPNFFTIKNQNKKHYELIFNRQYSSTVFIQRINAEDVAYGPFFFLDDDNIVLDLNEMFILMLVDRFEFFKNNNHKFKHLKLIKRDIKAIMNTSAKVSPFADNNKLKLQNRVRIVKTYRTNKDGDKEYFESIGEALWNIHVPNTEEDIRKYSRLFNDPISVVSPEKAVYCCLTDKQYKGIGYYADQDKIISIYPGSSNLPERLRQHYTSNYLEPVNPNKDYLKGEDQTPEAVTAVAVFAPIESEFEKPFGTEGSPIGENTLICGEILINEALSERRYYVRRTFQTTSLLVNIVRQGTILQPGDVLAYDLEGIPELIYDLKYENAVVESVEEQFGGYKIVVKTISPLNVARLISDSGLKGVTHPRKDLGLISFDLNGEAYEDMPVEMVLGPNSMKAGSNGLRLAWLALKQALEDRLLEVSPDKLSEEEVNNLTADIKKVKWTYNGKTTEVYAGIVTFGVTDLAKDCRTDYVRIMPETLKYMYLSGNDKLEQVADMLLGKYVSPTEKWAVREMLKLKSTTPEDDLPVWDYRNPELVSFLDSRYINASPWQNIDTSAVPPILLNPMNRGFYFKIEDTYVRMPSSKLINVQTTYANNSITYPQYFHHALWILIAIRNKTTVDNIMRNVANYYANIDQTLFEKRGTLASGVSPEVVGGHLKQLVSAHVPRGITVVLDRDLEKRIYKFMRHYHLPIYEIGVRNPVVWRFQFRPRRVWTIGQFERYLSRTGLKLSDVVIREAVNGSVLRNTIDALYDQSDTDGDLFPIAIPMDGDIQKLLREYVNHDLKIYDYEHDWTKEYIKGESSNSKFTDVERKPFKYYEVSRQWFGAAFANAAIAKMKIGTATIDLWKFHSACEIACLAGIFDREKMSYLQFLFSRIVHDRVIRGIKHNTNGSSDYEMYCLDSFNREAVKRDLTTYLQVSEEDAELFAEVATMANDNMHSKALSRLPGGGNGSTISRYADILAEIGDEVRYKHSYARIIGQYWNDLVKNKVSIKEEGESETPEPDFALAEEF